MFCTGIQCTNIYCGPSTPHCVPDTTAKNWRDVSLPFPCITELSPGVMSLPTGAPSGMLRHPGVMETHLSSPPGGCIFSHLLEG